ncbi:hypothetical protein B0T09DRAFT_30239 [Sordaria sp. MPI-SDFR-AT-0083]|nr:hypothetical protein B0T09DRAFT_30239 [Sordaria sp. MPI-SDFR-AT-0083]
MAISQRLLAVLKQAEFEDRGKGEGAVVKIHSRNVSAQELKETLKTIFPHSKYTIQLRRDRYSITFPEIGKYDLKQILLGHKPSDQQPKLPKLPRTASAPLSAIESKPSIADFRPTLRSSYTDAGLIITPRDALKAYGPIRPQREGLLIHTKCLLHDMAKSARNAAMKLVRL